MEMYTKKTWKKMEKDYVHGWECYILVKMAIMSKAMSIFDTFFSLKS